MTVATDRDIRYLVYGCSRGRPRDPPGVPTGQARRAARVRRGARPRPGPGRRCRRRRSPRASRAARGHQRPRRPPPSRRSAAGAGSSADGGAQHLGGELGVDGVAGRRAAPRAPSSASGRRAAARGSAAPAPAGRAARRARSAPARPRRGRGRRGRRSRRCRAARTPGASTADPRGELLGHAAAVDQPRGAPRRRRARGRSAGRAARAIIACTGSAKKSTVAWLSSGGRRLVTSQREARSTSVRISIRIRVCTAASSLLSQVVELVAQRQRAEDLAGHEVGPGQLGRAAPVSPAAAARRSCRRR